MSPEPPGLRAQASPAKETGGSGDESAPPLISLFAQNAAFASLVSYALNMHVSKRFFFYGC